MKVRRVGNAVYLEREDDPSPVAVWGEPSIEQADFVAEQINKALSSALDFAAHTAQSASPWIGEEWANILADEIRRGKPAG